MKARVNTKRYLRGNVGTILVLAIVVVLSVSCGEKEVESTPDVVVLDVTTLPTMPDDDAWSDAPQHVAALLLQDLVDPRLMEASTQNVRVRALTDGTNIAFRLSWDDETMNDLPGSSKFPDGCAVQLPMTDEPDLPAPQMGEKGRSVQITYWRASWQAVVDGRGDSIRDLYPAASVDHYPFEAASLKSDPEAQEAMEKRYAPARALGNEMAGPRENPVQALIADGPGTLRPDESTRVDGAGHYREGVWTVVISRPLPKALRSSSQSQVAFAVWEGSHDEVGARKMRTGWIPIVRRSE